MTAQFVLTYTAGMIVPWECPTRSTFSAPVTSRTRSTNAASSAAPSSIVRVPPRALSGHGACGCAL
ncbi:hypothetical protein [Dietzia lutea]|uniref:Uncharacterized protein n=1 Tax=Dietzia lutea TaxID=546160 RepID=A0A2S1RB71_9ACTN|nr:hypothetical protein [Dietzia lutea]AWH93540.1 hypothetical protein A6035_16695 [Dietzia lutea]